MSGNEFKEREAKISQYKNGSILSALTVPNIGCVSMGSRGLIGYIWAGASIAPTLKAKSVSSIRFQIILQDTGKFMLIDLFDAATNKPVGEYGFGGFKLYTKPLQTAERP